MTLDYFFEGIDDLLNNHTKFKTCAYPVFRGHSKKSYQLLPTLYRNLRNTDKDVWKLENNLYNDFRALVGRKFKFSNSWESLFVMRHEGIPTRLLDWTENIGTALFFALDAIDVQEPHLWILNPYALNRKSRNGDDSLLNPEEDLDQYHCSYAHYCFENDIEDKFHKTPIAIYPNRSNERLFAQRGVFTIHGTDTRALDETCSEVVEKVNIPETLIPKIKGLLKQFGINKYSVYPDFKGLSDYLKEMYRY